MAAAASLGEVGVEGGEGGAPVITSTMLVCRLAGHGSSKIALPDPYSLYDGQRGRDKIVDICSKPRSQLTQKNTN